MTSSNPQKQPHFLAALAVFAFCMIMIAASRGMGESYGIFLLPLSEAFGWSRANVTSIYAVYMVSFGFGSLLSGIVFDHFGPRFNYTIGLCMLAGCYWYAGNLESILSFYLVIGVCGGAGAAMVGIVPTQSLITRWFTNRRSTALSIAYSGQGLGMMLLAPTAQIMIESSGWQATYRLASYGFIIAFIFILLMPWKRIMGGVSLPEHAAKPKKHHVPVAINCKIKETQELSLSEAMQTAEFWGFFTIFGASAISVFAISLQAVAYLIEQGFSSVEAAIAFGCVGMLTVFGIALTGIIADRFPRHIVASASYCLTILGILSLATMQIYPSWALLVTFVVTFGLSAGARGPIITAQMAEMFAGRGLASIFGATNIGQGCGAALGAFLAGYLYDITGNYNIGFLVSFCFACLGLSMFWLVPAIRHGERSKSSLEKI